MNKWVELLKLVPEGLKNPKQVVEGVINSVKMSYKTLPEDEQEEIIRRRVICEGCPYFSLNLFEDDTEYQKLYEKEFESSRKGKRFCGICGCPEDTRTASLSSNCGLIVYNKEHPENKQELKWSSYPKVQEEK